jgi:hypothetical protein
MLKLLDHIRLGMPDSRLELYKLLREYHRFCHDVHVVDSVLCLSQVWQGGSMRRFSGQESIQTSSRRGEAA